MANLLKFANFTGKYVYYEKVKKKKTFLLTPVLVTSDLEPNKFVFIVFCTVHKNHVEILTPVPKTCAWRNSIET